MKKIFFTLLVICVLTVTIVPLSVIDANAATSGTSGNCTWKIEGQKLTISGNGSMGYGITDPWGKNFTEVVIEEGVTDIGVRAFSKCYMLEKVSLPSSLRLIYPLAFEDCKALKNITIPEGVTAIDLGAFANCTSLMEINIPKTVTIISDDFADVCKSLERVTVDKDNPNYVSVDGVLYNKSMTRLMKYPAKKQGTSYTVPDSVTEICTYAFTSAKYLQNVELPHFITKIGFNAFGDTHMSKTQTVDGAFYMGEYFISLDTDTKTEYSIKDGTRVIADNAFMMADGVKKVVIPEGVVTIGQYSLPLELENITVPKSVTFIGIGAFRYDDHIKNVYYRGTRADRAKIKIEEDNDILHSNVFQYESCIGNKTHDWNTKITKSAQCGINGTKELTCKVCGIVDTENIPALVHTYGDWINDVSPTCTKSGTQKRVCSICGKAETKTVDPSEHNFGAYIVEKEPTYDETGIMSATCSFCQTKSIQTIPILDKNVETEQKPNEQTQDPNTTEKNEIPATDNNDNKNNGKKDNVDKNEKNNTVWLVLTIVAVVAIVAAGTVIVILKRKK